MLLPFPFLYVRLHHVGKLLRSVAIGLIVALFCWLPCLRCAALTRFPLRNLTVPMKTPASYNLAVRRAAPAVVNVYNRGLNTNSHNQLLTLVLLGSGVIMDQRGYIITSKHVINNGWPIRSSSPYRMDVYLKHCWWDLTRNRSGGT